MSAPTPTEVELTAGAWNAFVEMEEAVPIDATDGAIVPYSSADQKILLIVQNTDETTIEPEHTAGDYTFTIKAGNGVQGGNDLTFEVEAGKQVCAVLESGKYLNMTGDNKGYIVIEGDETDADDYLVIQVIALP